MSEDKMSDRAKDKLDSLFGEDDDKINQNPEEPSPAEESQADPLAGLFNQGDDDPSAQEEVSLNEEVDLDEEVPELGEDAIVQPTEHLGGEENMTEQPPEDSQPALPTAFEPEHDSRKPMSKETKLGILATIALTTVASVGVIGTIASKQDTSNYVTQEQHDVTKKSVGGNTSAIEGLQSKVDKNSQDSQANAGKIDTLDGAVKDASDKAQNAQDAAKQAQEAADAAQARADEAYTKAQEAPVKPETPTPVDPVAPAQDSTKETYTMSLDAGTVTRHAKAMALVEALYQWDKKRGREDRWEDHELAAQYALEIRVNKDGNSILSEKEVADAIRNYAPIFKKKGIEITIESIGEGTTIGLERTVQYENAEQKENYLNGRKAEEAQEKRKMSDAEYVFRVTYGASKEDRK